jgi:Tfp pilus assembly PilM family ATPase
MVKRLRHRLNAFVRLQSRRGSRSRSPGVVTAIDLDGGILRVAQATSGVNVTRVVSAPLELPPDADRNDPLIVGAAVSKALAGLKLKPASVVMGVPRARVILRTLTLPVVEKLPELASLVHFQVGKDLPFRMDEAIIDFKVGRQIEIPAERTDPATKADAGSNAGQSVLRLEILVAAVKRDVVDFHQRLAEAAGLKLAGLGLLPYANSRFVEACQVADGNAAFALISLRPDEVGIDIIARQSLRFSRGAAIKLAVDPAVGVIEQFVSAAVIEAVRSLHSYGGIEANPAVEKVLVAGATGFEAAVVESLSNRTSVPCTRLEAAVALPLPAEARESAAGSMAAIGLALGQSDTVGLPFDFLNPKKPAIQRDLGRIRILIGVGAAALILTALLVIRSVLEGRRQAVLDAATTELADAEKKRPVYRKLTQQTAVVEDWVKGGRNWLEHYAYLSSVLPPSEEVYLTSLTVSGQGVIRMTVQARSGETLARLDRQLRAAGYEVRPIAINPGADRFGYEFRSNVELVVPPKLKIDLHKVRPAPRPLDDISLEPSAWKRGGA